jgi:hypothetical protein
MVSAAGGSAYGKKEIRNSKHLPARLHRWTKYCGQAMLEHSDCRRVGMTACIVGFTG